MELRLPMKLHWNRSYARLPATRACGRNTQRGQGLVEFAQIAGRNVSLDLGRTVQRIDPQQPLHFHMAARRLRHQAANVHCAAPVVVRRIHCPTEWHAVCAITGGKRDIRDYLQVARIAAPLHADRPRSRGLKAEIVEALRGDGMQYAAQSHVADLGANASGHGCSCRGRRQLL